MNYAKGSLLPNRRAGEPSSSGFTQPRKDSEWTFEDARSLWKSMTGAVQHVGVPGYQWQASVLWDGSLFLGPQLCREHSAVSQEAEALGENLLDVSVGFGAQMSFQMGMYFGGHIDLDASLAQDRNSITVSVALDLEITPIEIRTRLRSDDGRPLVSALVNGAQVPVQENDTIRLPNQVKGTYEVIGYFAAP